MMSAHLAVPPPVAGPASNALFPRVLLAIDFGSASLGAARWGTTHVAPDADAVLVHVMPTSDESSLATALVGGLGGFGATLSVASSRNIVRVGRPAGCLSAAANDAAASLLMLGRRADANRIHVGEPNVIERAARRVNGSILVVPEGTTHAPDHIIAAVDDSRFAPRVVEVAGRLARMHEARLTVLRVRSPDEGADPGRYATEVVVGDPAREIVRAAMRHECPLVIVGIRGSDDAPAGSLGSVSRELLTRGPMPVLAVNAT
jgi:nucleotide-binding universal stress UspA family protein